MANQLYRYAMRHSISGEILYTLYATQNQIKEANDNLDASTALARFVPIAGQPVPLPAARS
jgi:hypothetical protein